jgi:hypothetical protein
MEMLYNDFVITTIGQEKQMNSSQGLTDTFGSNQSPDLWL